MTGVYGAIITLMLFLLTGFADAEDVYIWTDKDGVTHIEDQAPMASSGAKTKVEKHTFEKSDPSAETNQSTGGVTFPSALEKTDAVPAMDPDRREKGRLRQEELEQARREYEEDKANERRYLHKLKDADNGKARHYWKGKLEELEEKRQKLEALEKAE